jgi:hypothetical protein
LKNELALARPQRAAAGAALAITLVLAACGDDGPTAPDDLPARPELVSPAPGAQLTTDTPLFTVLNARGYDRGEAEYRFSVGVAATGTEIAAATLPAGDGHTAMRFDKPLLRGATLSWRVTATRRGTDAISSEPATFKLPATSCPRPPTPFAQRLVDWWIPACSLAVNFYNDPEEVLGSPDAAEIAPNLYRGMVSLGTAGYVVVDMEGCAADGAGDDVRVYQTVSQEPVTLYAGSSPQGPWVLLEARKPCGARVPGVFSRGCTFDLGRAGLEEARYFKVEDGELYPCPGGSGSDGADIDAVEVLNFR